MSYKRQSPMPVAEGGTGLSTVTLHDVLVGQGTSAITLVAPSATAGIPFVSNGSSSDPSFTTAVVAGGGTGKTSFTAYTLLTGGTTTTGALQNVVSVGTSGQVLTSNGASALPTFQAAPAGGVTTINGNSGSVTGSTITITGGTSGAVFTGSGTTLTESFNYLALPTTTSTNGQITINGTPFLHDFGSNVFLGEGAGNFTTSGVQNIGIGNGGVLSLLVDGSNNIAIGNASMSGGAVSASNNTAIGVDSLFSNVSSDQNVVLGHFSGFSIASGSGLNTILGYANGGGLVSGDNNTFIGSQVAVNYAGAESSNIIINNPGTLGESNVLRIGAGTGTSAQQLNKAFISGIRGITVTGTAVLVSSSDQLGVAVSSARFKDNIQDMGDYSSPILNLRPTTFNYNVGEDKSLQGGLIAEEVAQVMPSLVVYDQEGLPQTVKYHDMPALLLNELQKALKRIESLEAKLQDSNSSISDL